MRRLPALAVLALLSCARPDREGEFTLRVVGAGDLAPLRPDTTTGLTAAAADLVYQALLRVGEDGRLEPAVARRWERLALDRLRVQLDPGAVFSDGTGVRDEDVIASLAAAGFEVRRAGEWIEIGRGSSRDPLEVALLYAFIYKEARPAPLGTGPFAPIEGDPAHLVLRRVKPAPGRIAKVEFRAVATTRDAFARLLRGEADATFSLNERQSELLEGVPGLRVVRGEGPHAVAAVLNARRFPAGARADLMASVPGADVTRAYGGACRGYRESGPPRRIAEGQPLQIMADTFDPGLVRVALSLRRALGPRGGEVSLVSQREALARRARHDFDVSVDSLLAWPPLVLGWYWRTGAAFNRAAYSNHRVDEAFDRGDVATATAEMEKDPPAIYICRRQRIAAVPARIRNATLGRWGLLDTLPDWEVGP